MANKVAAAALQYSKKLSKFISWTWAIYRFAILIVAAIQPSVASDIAATIPGMDTIMMANVCTYLINSLGEKILYSDRFAMKWLDKGGFKSLIGKFISHDEEGDEEDGDNQNG